MVTKQVIDTIWAKVHSPTGLPFPETVAALLNLSVTRYHIDYIARTAMAYLGITCQGEKGVHVAPIPLPERAPSDDFVQEGVKAAIEKVQKGESTYEESATDRLNAGVVGYMAFLEGQNAM